MTQQQPGLIEAAKLALEALENTTPTGFNMERDKQFFAAITTLRPAIEAAEKQGPENPDEVGTGCECANCANGMGECQSAQQKPVSGYIKKIEDLIQERDDARSSRDFYKRRADALQQWQSKMRDPERTIVCDILANGCTLEPAGDRYAIPAAQPSPVQDPVADAATAAGLSASVGHLSALVDELRCLLGRAMANFTTLHNAASPDDGPDMDAIIPADVFAKFVNEDAALRYAIKQSAHDGMCTPLAAPVQEPDMELMHEPSIEVLRQQMKGRAQFLRDRGEVKTPQLLEIASEFITPPAAQPAVPLTVGVGGGLVAIKTLLSRDPCAHATLAIEMIDAMLNTANAKHAPREPIKPVVDPEFNSIQRLYFKYGWKSAEEAHGIKDQP